MPVRKKDLVTDAIEWKQSVRNKIFLSTRYIFFKGHGWWLFTPEHVHRKHCCCPISLRTGLGLISHVHTSMRTAQVLAPFTGMSRLTLSCYQSVFSCPPEKRGPVMRQSDEEQTIGLRRTCFHLQYIFFQVPRWPFRLSTCTGQVVPHLCAAHMQFDDVAQRFPR